jgi:predicted ribosome-associated RNA-binding protein Tma20
MFQKEFKTKKSSIIRKSDRKKLVAEIAKSMPELSSVLDSDDDVELMVCSLQNETEKQCNVYTMNQVPLFFAFGHVDDMDPLFPTVMTLARFALQPSTSSFPIFPTHKFVVVDKLMAKTAADFMLPGLLGPVGGRATWKVNDVVLITVGGVAMCVARALMSSDEVNAKLARNEPSGKLARVIHCYRDGLYALTNMKDRDRFEFALNAPSQPQSSTTTSAATATTSTTTESSTTTTTTTTSLTSSSSNIATNDDNNGDTSTSTTTSSVEENEKNLDDAFFAALLATKNEELPLLVSTFHARLLAHRAEGTVIDVKKTRWKKLMPFMQQKQQDGVIKLVETSAGVLSIESIDRQHRDVRNARSIARALEAPPAPAGLSVRSLVDAAAAAATSAALASSTSTSYGSDGIGVGSTSNNTATTTTPSSGGDDVERLFLPRISQLLLVPE